MVTCRFSLMTGTDCDLFDEPLLAVHAAGVVVVGRPNIRSVRFHVPGIDNIGKIDGKHLVVEKPHQLGIMNREGHFYPAIEIARHHVRTSKINLLFPSITEIVNAAMLKESSHDTRDP